MTTKEMFDLSGEIRKTREDCKKKGLLDAADCLEYIANSNIVYIYNYKGETIACNIDRVIIGDLGLVECVCSGVQDPDFEKTANVRTLNIHTIISVMEFVAEYFDFMDEIASKK